MKEIKNRVCEILLESKSVFLSVKQPFTWASGIKSPIYCDNRQVLAFPKYRQEISEFLIQALAPYKYDAIIGTATAGIPMASILADKLGKPLGYVRSGTKDHGLHHQIEGFQQSGSKVIVIEDLISTGGSVIKVVEALRQAGVEVVQVVAVFSYNLEVAAHKMATHQIPYQALSDFDTLIDVALSSNLITKSDISKLQKFQKNPQDQIWME